MASVTFSDGFVFNNKMAFCCDMLDQYKNNDTTLTFFNIVADQIK